MPPPRNRPATSPANFRPRKMLPAASPRKPAWASLAFSLPSSASFFGCRGLARAGLAFSSILVMASDFFSALSAGDVAAFARVLQFVEPFQGPRLAGRHEVQRPPRQRGEGAEQRQGTRLSKLIKPAAKITDYVRCGWQFNCHPNSGRGFIP